MVLTAGSSRLRLGSLLAAGLSIVPHYNLHYLVEQYVNGVSATRFSEDGPPAGTHKQRDDLTAAEVSGLLVAVLASATDLEEWHRAEENGHPTGREEST